MNLKIKQIIAAGTIIATGGIVGYGTIPQCDGEAVTYERVRTCLDEAAYKTYSKEILKEYRKGEVGPGELDKFLEVLTIERRRYSEDGKEFKLRGANKDNIIELTINELQL